MKKEDGRNMTCIFRPKHLGVTKLFSLIQHKVKNTEMEQWDREQNLGERSRLLKEEKLRCKLAVT